MICTECQQLIDRGYIPRLYARRIESHPAESGWWAQLLATVRYDRKCAHDLTTDELIKVLAPAGLFLLEAVADKGYRGELEIKTYLARLSTNGDYLDVEKAARAILAGQDKWDA